MLARGELRDNAAIFAVNIDLRGDDAGKNAPPAGDDGRRRFVARRLDAENEIFAAESLSDS